MTTLITQQLSVNIGDVSACHALSMTFSAGQVWSVLGRNGVGKSTLLKTLAGLRRPTAGDLIINDKLLSTVPRRKRAQLIGMLFQEQDPTFPATVLETALTGRHPWLSLFAGESPTDVDLAQQELNRMGLDGMQKRELFSLSGGERRRVDLSALVLQDTKIALLDEPANHLDLHYQTDILGDLINRWKLDNRIVIMVMHDLNLAMRFSDHLLLLFGEGETLHGKTSDLATEKNLSRLYGHSLKRYPAEKQYFFLPT